MASGINFNTIVQLVRETREMQDTKWGGHEHDRMHGIDSWIAIITKHAGKPAMGDDSDTESKLFFAHQMVTVAALAFAAIESLEEVDLVELASYGAPLRGGGAGSTSRPSELAYEDDKEVGPLKSEADPLPPPNEMLMLALGPTQAMMLESFLSGRIANLVPTSMSYKMLLDTLRQLRRLIDGTTAVDRSTNDSHQLLRSATKS